ncbi:MAG: LysE family translocator [Bacillota bacterium]
MLVTFFLKGIIVGLAMTISIGPITIMCIRETLATGQSRGLVIGLGASTGDLFYSTIAAFGLTVISDALIAQQFWIRLIGGIILFFLAAKTFRSEPADPKVYVNNGGMIKLYLTSVLIAATNPITIFAFLALFATFGLANEYNHLRALAIVTGVFVGSFAWFIVLTAAIRLFRHKFDVYKLRIANKIAGALIFIAGVIAVLSLIL